MRILFVFIAMCLFGGVAISAAEAGQCTTQIKKLEKVLSKSDAGMGSTAAPSSSNTGTPITEGMNNAVSGKAASPNDVQQQNQGGQTAADAAKSGKRVPNNMRDAEQSLSRAKELDKAGQETECRNEVAKARAAFGAQ